METPSVYWADPATRAAKAKKAAYDKRYRARARASHKAARRRQRAGGSEGKTRSDNGQR